MTDIVLTHFEINFLLDILPVNKQGEKTFLKLANEQIINADKLSCVITLNADEIELLYDALVKLIMDIRH